MSRVGYIVSQLISPRRTPVISQYSFLPPSLSVTACLFAAARVTLPAAAQIVQSRSFPL